jgi:hypothetical protein
MSEERIKIELGGGFAITLSILYLLLGFRLLAAVLAARSTTIWAPAALTRRAAKARK